MLTTQCSFFINHDGKSNQVVFYTHSGITYLFQKDAGNAYSCVFSAAFVCEDRKAAELFVQLYTQQKNKP